MWFRVWLQKGERVLIAAHGNSLRGLVKYLDKIPDDEIVELNIPTGLLKTHCIQTYYRLFYQGLGNVVFHLNKALLHLSLLNTMEMLAEVVLFLPSAWDVP